MRRRRANQEPDTRLDWRDPDMPVLRVVEYSRGFQTWIETEEFSPEEESQNSQKTMVTTTPMAPHWTQDPTYRLTNRRKRR